jgi:hypothetical protein
MKADGIFCSAATNPTFKGPGGTIFGDRSGSSAAEERLKKTDLPNEPALLIESGLSKRYRRDAKR